MAVAMGPYETAAGALLVMLKIVAVVEKSAGAAAAVDRAVDRD